MPKKGAGGKRHKRGKKTEEETKIDAPHKVEDTQEYAQVSRMLGNGRVQSILLTPQRESKLCIIPGKFKKRKVWINQGDLVLVGLRSFEQGKCDIMYKYSDAEVRQLQNHGEIDKNYQIGSDLVANASDESSEEGFVFGDEEVDLETL